MKSREVEFYKNSDNINGIWTDIDNRNAKIDS